MNSITRKLLLSILTVVLTVIALGTTTFAWFTLTNTAVVQPFNAQVVSDTGIEVAVGDINTADLGTLQWRTTISTDDIYAYMASVYGANAFRFQAVTTTDGYNFKDMYGDDTTSGYLEIPLHFRSPDQTSIKWSEVGLQSTAAPYTTPVAFTDSSSTARTQGGTFSANLQDAMKLSIRGITSRPEGLDPVYSTLAYENPAEGTNTLSGGWSNVDRRGALEDVTRIIDGVPTTVQEYTGAPGSQSFYYRSTFSLPAGSNQVSTFGTITSLSSNVVLLMADGSLETAGARYYGNAVIRVWFEGWDAEAYNALLSRILTISLKFSA